MSDKPGKNPDTWLADESTVSRAYDELKKAGPPVHLDEQILSEARRAAATQDHTVIRVQRWRKWTMPAALAATVVFAVPLVVRVFDNAAEFDTDRGTAAVTMTGKTADAELAVTGETAAEPKSSAPVADEISQSMFEDATPERREELSALLREHLETAGQAPPESLENAASESAGLIGSVRRDTKQPDSAAMPPATASATPSADTATTAGTPPPSAVAAETPALAPAKDVDFYARRPSPGVDKPAAAFRDDAFETGSANESETTVQPTARPATEPKPMREDSRAADSERKRRDTAGFAMQNVPPPAAEPMARLAGDREPDAAVEEVMVTGSTVEAAQWLIDIADQHRRGRVRTARFSLGFFLTDYPDYELPDDFPLQAHDALYGDDAGEIVPEAALWLRGIGMMAQRGDIDQARTQLAEFFKIYPDYPLPPDFPLTREDAQPIER